MCTSYKILRKIIEQRLKPYADNMFGEYQAGFRTYRSITDQMFSVKIVLEKCWEYDIGVYHRLWTFVKPAIASIVMRSINYHRSLKFNKNLYEYRMPNTNREKMS